MLCDMFGSSSDNDANINQLEGSACNSSDLNGPWNDFNHRINVVVMTTTYKPVTYNPNSEL